MSQELVDIDSIEHAVKYAQKIARKMSKDPEVDSLAGEAAWRALYTWDRAKNVKISWWIAHLTKQSIQYYWRKMSKLREHEKLLDELWWQEQSQLGRVDDRVGHVHYREDNRTLRHREWEERDLEISREDWQLLVESLVLKHPLDVIARDRGISRCAATKLRAAALSRLEAAC